MIIVAAIALLVVCLLMWLLFMPVVVEINTDTGVYRVAQTGTMCFWLTPDFQPHLRVLGFEVSMKRGEVATQKVPKAKAKKKSRSVSWGKVSALLLRLRQSISVRKLQLDVDTDDVMVNSQLVPIFFFLSRGPVQLAANFQGRLYACLDARAKVYRIVWALFLFFTTK